MPWVIFHHRSVLSGVCSSWNNFEPIIVNWYFKYYCVGNTTRPVQHNHFETFDMLKIGLRKGLVIEMAINFQLDPDFHC